MGGDLNRTTHRDLIAAALQARERAYAPYSGFSVGAALLTATGRVFEGCNVENAVYGATICAERTAIVKAVSEGERDFVRIAVVGDTGDVCVPCGICRQVLVEFGADIEVVMVNLAGQVRVQTISELMPGPFTRASLFPHSRKDQCDGEG